MPVLKVKAKSGIPYLPDTPNQPNSYSSPKNCLARKLSEIFALAGAAPWFHTLLHYVETNNKSTTPISEGLTEKKLKVTKAETAFVRLLSLLYHTVVDK